MSFSNEGTPLPDPKDPSRFREDPRRHREMVPTQGDYSRDVIGSKQTVEDARVRQVRAQQYREWHFRAKGRQPSDAEVNSFLDGPEAA